MTIVRKLRKPLPLALIAGLLILTAGLMMRGSSASAQYGD